MKIRITFYALLVAITSLMMACSSNTGIEKRRATPMTAAPQKPIPYAIQSGDSLEIKFFYNPELNETVTVRPDGKISLQLIDDIEVWGLEPAQLDEILTKMYSKELRKPVLTVFVRSFSSQRVFVGGEVFRPGLIEIAPGMDLDAVQAVFQAGGLRDTAQLEETIIIRKGKDNKPIPIRLDLAAAMEGGGSGGNFQLQPNDIIYVPKSAIARADLWVDQYVRQLFLFNGWSFGFAYELRDNVRIKF